MRVKLPLKRIVCKVESCESEHDRSTENPREVKRVCGCTGVDAHLDEPFGADVVVTGHVWYHPIGLVTAHAAVRVPSVFDEALQKVVATAIGVVSSVTSTPGPRRL